MSTTQTFSALLKQYTPHNLFVAELERLNYFWNKIDKDRSWFGGDYIIPFESGEASNIKYGGLTAAASITESKVVKGTVSSYRELYGAMIFNHKDLDADNLKASFLKLVPNKIEQFSKFMSEAVSQALLNGAAIVSFTADATLNTGYCTVDRPERLRIGQGLHMYNTTDAAGDLVYVREINRDAATNNVRLSESIDLSDAVDFSTKANYTVAKAAKLYAVDNAPDNSNAFTSLKDSLLSNANGGSANLYGIAKTLYPYLQAVNIDGSSITSSNIIDELMDAFKDVAQLGQGNPEEMIMSLQHANSISKLLKNNVRYEAMDKKAGFGYKSFVISGPTQDIRVTGIRDMDDSEIFIIDWSALKFVGSRFFEKMDYDGNEFFVSRGTSGVSYIVDIKFYGDLVVHRPSNCGVIHSISY